MDKKRVAKKQPEAKKEEKGKKAPRKWGETVIMIIAMLIWVGSSILVAQFLVGYIMFPILGRERLMQPVFTAIYSALSYVVAMVLIIYVPILITRKRKKKITTDREHLGLRGLPTWTDIGLAPAGFILYLLIAMLLVGIFSSFPWFNPEEAQNIGFNVYSTGLDRVVAFITLVVIAPIAEEVIFRGWLYDKVRGLIASKYTERISIIVSILLVSLLFGIVHMQWNVGVNVFAMSIVLCGLREITGTIYSGILLHMLKNGVAFYLLFVVGMS